VHSWIHLAETPKPHPPPSPPVWAQTRGSHWPAKMDDISTSLCDPWVRHFMRRIDEPFTICDLRYCLCKRLFPETRNGWHIRGARKNIPVVVHWDKKKVWLEDCYLTDLVLALLRIWFVLSGYYLHSRLWINWPCTSGQNNLLYRHTNCLSLVSPDFVHIEFLLKSFGLVFSFSSF
jgi:hypothetical protein